MKVENMESPRGNTVPNQFIILDDSGIEYFQFLLLYPTSQE